MAHPTATTPGPKPGRDPARFLLWSEDHPRRVRFMPSVWLAFLAIPIVSTWTGHESVLHASIVTAISIVFAGQFAWMTSRVALGSGETVLARRADRVRAVFFLAVPVFLCFYDNPGWLYFFVYSLFPLMRLVRQERRWRIVLLIGALTVAVGVAAGTGGGNLIGATSIVLGSGGSWLGFGRILEANAVLREAHEERAQAAVAEERLRFARDLHDLLGHSLSVITLKSEVAGRLIDRDTDRAKAELDEIEQVARRALREVREAVAGYRKPTLDTELAGARRALADAGIGWREHVESGLRLSPHVEGVLAWTVREGVTNVVRHSGAADCSLDVHRRGQDVEAVIVDNGTGDEGGVGNGLLGLRERVGALEGTLDSGAAPDGGFRLAVLLPLAAPDPAGRTAGQPAPVA